MGEAWELLAQYVTEGTEATGEAGAAATEAVQTTPSPVETPLDKADSKNDTAKKMNQKKRPPLQVIDGGKTDKDQQKSPLGTVVKGMDDFSLSLPDLPTPGGISLVLVLVLFLLFAVAKLPQGGTRLQLLFRAMMGAVHINPGAATPSGQGSTAATSTQKAVNSASIIPTGALSNYGEYY